MGQVKLQSPVPKCIQQHVRGSSQIGWKITKASRIRLSDCSDMVMQLEYSPEF